MYCNTKMGIILGLVMLVVVAFGQEVMDLDQKIATNESATKHPPEATKCIQPKGCGHKRKTVCGRFDDGYCQLFNSVCSMRAKFGGSPTGVIPTHPRDCRKIRKAGSKYRRPCYSTCSAKPRKCKRSDPDQEICVMSRSRLTCRVLASKCQLRNYNCHYRPRFNWFRTNKRRCLGLNVTDKPGPCRYYKKPGQKKCFLNKKPKH